MSDGSVYIFVFAIISFITSICNLAIMVYLVSKLKSDIVDRHIHLAKEQNVFLSKQQVALGSSIQMNSERIEAVERLLSAIIMGPGGQGMDDGTTH